MAKFESEGYCPCIWVPQTWNENTDKRLIGLWSLIGASVVYEKTEKCCPGTDYYDQMFSNDPISYQLMSAIVKKNVNAHKIFVRRMCAESDADIQAVLRQVDSPEVILHARSNFAIILANAEYGLDLWVWDLRTAC